MYQPKHFSVTDDQQIDEIIHNYGFATILSFEANGDPYINHLPVLLEVRDGVRHLVGHMARKNPQWQHWRENPKATVLFHGPHTYITPKWYVSGRDVPTWNYAAIHVHGAARGVEDFEPLVEILKKSSEKYESTSSNPWQFGLPQDLLEPKVLTAAIVGFEITIEKVEAKFKLSQNRPLADKQAVVEGLGQRTDDNSREISQLMQTFLRS